MASSRSQERPPSSPRSGSYGSESGISPQTATSTSASSDIPRPKRIACVVCRKRKLRCDGIKPSCGTCSRLSHDCAYDEVRRKSGPKRGYVKALEARLAQVETMLKGQGPVPHVHVTEQHGPDRFRHTLQTPCGSQYLDVDPPLYGDGDSSMDGMGSIHGSSVSPNLQGHISFENSPMMDIPHQQWPIPLPIPPMPIWDLVSMGLDEPLPEPDIVEALDRIYFEKIHASIPIIHKGRYYASLNMGPSLRPPVSLRYAMWAMAASVSDDSECSNLQTHFYRRARKCLEESEMKGHGEGFIAVASSQAWQLVASYEFKLMYFPRAWMSTGRAVRLAQMMGLHRVDGGGAEVKLCLPPPRDEIEREERRRTFWTAFCLDRYASIGTGWPMSVEEKDVLTNLPGSEEAFEYGRPYENPLALKEAMSPEGAALVSSYGGVCLMASLFGRNLIHLHRPDPDERDDDLNGQFWRRHRNMDNILLSIQMSLPPHFRLPAGMNDSNVIFTNLNIYTSTICLHQAAIFKAEKHRLQSAESKIRCITAAAQIAAIMRMICHLDLSGVNPFISFCLYVAARVFVQYLKSRPGDEQVRNSLQFLLTTMGVMKKKNPLTESFLVQLDVDLSSAGQEHSTSGRYPYTMRTPQTSTAPPKPRQGFNYVYPIAPLDLVQETPAEEHPFITVPVPVPVPVPIPGGNHSRSRSTGSAPIDSFQDLSPKASQNGQSPASIDISDQSQNSTTPNTSSNGSYSPPNNFFSEYASIVVEADVMDTLQFSSKDMTGWDLLGDFDGPEFDGGMAGMLANPELGEYFTEQTA